MVGGSRRAAGDEGKGPSTFAQGCMIQRRGGRVPMLFSCLNSSLKHALACPWPVARTRNQEVGPRDLLDPVLAATARSTSVSLACDALQGFDSDTVHHHLRKLSPEESLAYAQEANRNLLRQARETGLLREPQVVALDTHKDPDYTHDHEDCIRARGHRGTGYVLDYLSVETVGDPRLTLSFVPVTAKQPVRDCYAKVLGGAQRECAIRMLLADRGTYGRPLMRALQERGIPYVIAAPRNSLIKRRIKNAKPRAKPVPGRGCFYHETKVTLRGHGPPLTTNVVLFWRPDKKPGKLVCFPFATSETLLTPERAHELAYMYLKRWNIETGYRIKNKLRIRTCSPHPGVRRFLQYFSILAHNLWTLVRAQEPHRKRKEKLSLRAFQAMLDTLVATRAH